MPRVRPVPTLTERVDDGDRIIILQTDDLRVEINVDAGAHIYRILHRPSQTELLYRDPRGSRHHRLGGWFELFPNAGPGGTWRDRHVSQHGDVRKQPWRWESTVRCGSSLEVRLSARSRDLPLLIARRVRLTVEGAIELREVVTNPTRHALPYLWGHHVTFGTQLMGPDSRIELPPMELFAHEPAHPRAPYAPGARGRLHDLPGRDGGRIDLSRWPQGRFTVMLLAEDLTQHWCRVSDPRGVAATLTWDERAFPALWLWATRRASDAVPEATAFAVEPQSSAIPGLAAAEAAGRAPVIPAGGSRRAWVRLRVDSGVELGADGGGSAREALGYLGDALHG